MGQGTTRGTPPAKKAKAASGVYDVIVLSRSLGRCRRLSATWRPNQVEFDYPTMSEDAVESSLALPCADACHVWVWTTHKFLPMALRLLEAWELNYVCTFRLAEAWRLPAHRPP